VADDGLERDHAWHAKLFEERHLRLDRRHERRDDIDDLTTKPREAGGLRLAILRLDARSERLGKLREARVETDDDRVSASPDGGSEAIREIRHEVFSRKCGFFPRL